MIDQTRFRRATLQLGALSLVALLSACGYAKRKDVDNQMAQLRSQMQAGDSALGNRIDQNERQDAARDAALRQDLEALRDTFNTKMTKLEGLISFDVPVHFDFNKYALRPEDTAVLDKFAGVVKAYYPDAIITVEGFTDPAGTRAYNMRLGRKRADAVRDYLVSNGGLDPAHVRTVSYGEDRSRLLDPKAKGPGEEGVINRRVTLVIDYRGNTGAMVSVAN